MVRRGRRRLVTRVVAAAAALEAERKPRVGPAERVGDREALQRVVRHEVADEILRFG